MNESVNDERISAYLDGELAFSERAAFEDELRSDEQLADAVGEFRDLERRFRDWSELASETRLGRDLSEQVVSHSTVRQSDRAASSWRTDWRVWTSVAAVLAVALGVWASRQGGPAPDNLASQEPENPAHVAEAEGDETQQLPLSDPSIEQVVAQLLQREQSVVIVEAWTLPAAREDASRSQTGWFKDELEKHGLELDSTAVADPDNMVDVFYVVSSPHRMAWFLQDLTQSTKMSPVRAVLKDAATGRGWQESFPQYVVRDGLAVDQELLEALRTGTLDASDVGDQPLGTALEGSTRQLDTFVRLDRLRERRRNRALRDGETWAPEIAVVFVAPAARLGQ